MDPKRIRSYFTVTVSDSRRPLLGGVMRTVSARFESEETARRFGQRVTSANRNEHRPASFTVKASALAPHILDSEIAF
jgi:hypothetical protein